MCIRDRNKDEEKPKTKKKIVWQKPWKIENVDSAQVDVPDEDVEETCHQTVLHIGACAHLSGAAQKDTHLTGTDFREPVSYTHLPLVVAFSVGVWVLHNGQSVLDTDGIAQAPDGSGAPFSASKYWSYW